MPKNIPVSKKSLPPLSKAERRAARLAEANSEIESRTETKKATRTKRLRRDFGNLIAERRDTLVNEQEAIGRIRDAAYTALHGRSVPDGNGLGGVMIDPDSPGQIFITKAAESELRAYLADSDRNARAPSDAHVVRLEAAITREKSKLEQLRADLANVPRDGNMVARFDKFLYREGGAKVAKRDWPEAAGDLLNIEKHRATKAKLKAELADLKNADRDPAEAKALAIAAIDNHAKKGRYLFDVSEFTMPDGRKHLDFIDVMTPDPATGISHPVPALRDILCAVFTDRIKEFALEKLDRHYQKKPGISEEARAARITKIRSEILELDFRIVAEVRALKAKNIPAFHVDVSPWAILGLRRIGKEPRRTERSVRP